MSIHALGGCPVADVSDSIVETAHLTKIYQNRRIALNDVTLSVEPGCVLGLLGPNGAGKTTFLRLLLGLHRPTAGWIKLFGEVMSPNAAHLRRRVGYIPTNPQFPRGMTPITYLDYMARLFGLSRDARKPRLASLIRSVDLLPHSGEMISGFSPGMVARLAVAASLINDPELLIWDEPTHGLDIEARRGMLELIKTLASEKTLILCSHHLSDVEEVCDQVVVLSQGQMIFQGSLTDLKGRIRKDHYEIELDGDPKVVAKAAQQLKSMTEEFKDVQSRQRRIQVQFNETSNTNSFVMAQLFTVLSDQKLTLIGFRALGQQTEEAFLELLEQEESRGFIRLCKQAA